MFLLPPFVFRKPSMNVFISCTATKMCGNEGILLPDKDGYYSSIIGGLNIDNTSGDRYLFDREIEKLFDQSGALNKRGAAGKLRGELEHPDWPSTMSEDDYAARMLFIDSRNTCVHWQSIWVEPSRTNRNADGSIVYDVWGKYKPEGPMKSTLQDALDNKHANLMFSLRGFTHDDMVGLKRYRRLIEVITYDLVNDGGIPTAQKFGTPERVMARECHRQGRALTKAGLTRALHKRGRSSAMESAMVDADALFKAFGWVTPTELGFARWGK